MLEFLSAAQYVKRLLCGAVVLMNENNPGGIGCVWAGMQRWRSRREMPAQRPYQRIPEECDPDGLLPLIENTALEKCLLIS